ncbi:MAG: hotdog domain-containing protein, partial [Pseudomonadota bacterium]|nr:hotdog domain-containing protein [Pseudomonadota bacterium]
PVAMYPVRIPRHACSPRDRARAGDLWRLVQEATILQSVEAGWPPSRYRDVGSGFVVREMTGLHDREAEYGEDLIAFTRVVESRRELLMRRESGIVGVLRGSVEWVHVGAQGGPARAPRALVDAFPVEPATAPVALPVWDEVEHVPLPELVIRPWWTEMDPMGHVNHPRYVDWADEAVSAWLAERGHDPLGLVPVAERVRFRTAAKAGDDVVVRGALVGRLPERGAAVIHLRMRRGEELVCDVVLVRAHLDGPAVWPGGTP